MLDLQYLQGTPRRTRRRIKQSVVCNRRRTLYKMLRRANRRWSRLFISGSVYTRSRI